MRHKYIVVFVVGRKQEYRIVRGADITTALVAFNALKLTFDRITSIAEV